jgi:hypothetical protein
VIKPSLQTVQWTAAWYVNVFLITLKNAHHWRTEHAKASSLLGARIKHDPDLKALMIAAFGVPLLSLLVLMNAIVHDKVSTMVIEACAATLLFTVLWLVRCMSLHLLKLKKALESGSSYFSNHKH